MLPLLLTVSGIYLLLSGGIQIKKNSATSRGFQIIFFCGIGILLIVAGILCFFILALELPDDLVRTLVDFIGLEIPDDLVRALVDYIGLELPNDLVKALDDLIDLEFPDYIDLSLTITSLVITLFGTTLIALILGKSSKIVQGLVKGFWGLFAFVLGVSGFIAPIKFYGGISSLFLVSSGQIILVFLAVIFGVVTYFKVKNLKNLSNETIGDRAFSESAKDAEAGKETGSEEARFFNKKWVNPSTEFWWCTAIIVLVLVALLEPHLPNFFGRVSYFKTPWFEAQLGVPGEKEKDDYTRFKSNLPYIPFNHWEGLLKKSEAIINLRLLYEKVNNLNGSMAQESHPMTSDYRIELDRIRKFKDFIEAIGLMDFSEIINYEIKDGLAPELLRIEARCWIKIINESIYNVKEKNSELVRPIRSLCDRDKGDELKKAINEFFKKQKKGQTILVKTKIAENEVSLKDFAKNFVFFKLYLSNLNFFVGNTQKAKDILDDLLKEFGEQKRERDLQLIHYYTSSLINTINNRTLREDFTYKMVQGWEICLNKTFALKYEIKQIHADIKTKLIRMGQALYSGDDFICFQTDSECGDYLTHLEDYKSAKQKTKEQDWDNAIINLKNNLAYSYAQKKENELLARQYADQIEEWMKDNPGPRDTNFLDTVGFVYLQYSKTKEDLKNALLNFDEAIYWAENTEKELEKKLDEVNTKIRRRDEEVDDLVKIRATWREGKKTSVYSGKIFKAHKKQANQLLGIEESNL